MCYQQNKKCCIYGLFLFARSGYILTRLHRCVFDNFVWQGYPYSKINSSLELMKHIDNLRYF